MGRKPRDHRATRASTVPWDLSGGSGNQRRFADFLAATSKTTRGDPPAFRANSAAVLRLSSRIRANVFRKSVDVLGTYRKDGSSIDFTGSPWNRTYNRATPRAARLPSSHSRLLRWRVLVHLIGRAGSARHSVSAAHRCRVSRRSRAVPSVDFVGGQATAINSVCRPAFSVRLRRPTSKD